MKVIDDVMDILTDGEWHTRQEIMEKTKLNQEKLDKLLRFLGAYGFIRLCTQRPQVKVTTAVLEFLREIKG